MRESNKPTNNLTFALIILVRNTINYASSSAHKFYLFSARLIQGEYRTADEAVAALKACFKLNSVQTRALLSPLAPPDVVEAGVAYVRSHTDELYRADGRDIRLEESSWLGAGLLIPSDGFSAEVGCFNNNDRRLVPDTILNEMFNGASAI